MIMPRGILSIIDGLVAADKICQHGSALPSLFNGGKALLGPILQIVHSHNASNAIARLLEFVTGI